MTYRKLRNSAHALTFGTTEGRYLRLRPDTELENTGDEQGQHLTAVNRQSLNTFMYGGMHESPAKVNQFGDA